jgi:hypothetical protein
MEMASDETDKDLMPHEIKRLKEHESFLQKLKKSRAASSSDHNISDNAVNEDPGDSETSPVQNNRIPLLPERAFPIRRKDGDTRGKS